MRFAETSPDPEQRASLAELSQLLEEVVLGLPEKLPHGCDDARR